MKPNPNHAIVAATVFAIAALAELAAHPDSTAVAGVSDPSVPSASAALASGEAREGNVKDLTY